MVEVRATSEQWVTTPRFMHVVIGLSWLIKITDKKSILLGYYQHNPAEIARKCNVKVLVIKKLLGVCISEINGQNLSLMIQNCFTK